MLATMQTLEVHKREGGKKIQEIREKGGLTAVVYGPKTESFSVYVDLIGFKKLLEQAGESTLINLKGDGFEHDVLIHDIDFDPVTDEPVHVDFYAVEKGQKVKVPVQLEFEGIAPAIKELGGTLVKVLHEVEVEAEPRNLPHNLIVDISPLINFESKIHAKDIVLPNGVSLITMADEVIALVQAPREEEPEEPAEEFDATKIEVEEKGKKEEEVVEGATPEEKK